MLILFLVRFVFVILIGLIIASFIYMNKLHFNFSINVHSGVKGEELQNGNADKADKAGNIYIYI